jgi:tRNA modification GTPase
LVNKVDRISTRIKNKIAETLPKALFLSAKSGEGLEPLQEKLLSYIETGFLRNEDPVVSNSRHYEALIMAQEAIVKVQEGIDEEIPSDLLSIDINRALFHLGEITGEITSDDLLGNIFANFCIGK